MRRHAPRPLEAALESFRVAAAPAGLLAQVQAAWPDVAGTQIAAEAGPVGERDGVVTVACSSAGWAHELALLAPELVERLNGRLSDARDAPKVLEMRFRTAASGAP